VFEDSEKRNIRKRSKNTHPRTLWSDQGNWIAYDKQTWGYFLRSTFTTSIFSLSSKITRNTFWIRGKQTDEWKYWRINSYSKKSLSLCLCGVFIIQKLLPRRYYYAISYIEPFICVLIQSVYTLTSEGIQESFQSYVGNWQLKFHSNKFLFSHKFTKHCRTFRSFMQHWSISF